jgi:hypothetical protein
MIACQSVSLRVNFADRQSAKGGGFFCLFSHHWSPLFPSLVGHLVSFRASSDWTIALSCFHVLLFGFVMLTLLLKERGVGGPGEAHREWRPTSTFVALCVSPEAGHDGISVDHCALRPPRVLSGGDHFPTARALAGLTQVEWSSGCSIG